MPADSQLLEASNKVGILFLKTALPIIIVGGVLGLIISYIRRNTNEAVNRFFRRRSQTEKKCPLDGGRLIKRRGKYGPFLGCSNYPSCKYTEGGIKEE